MPCPSGSWARSPVRRAGRKEGRKFVRRVANSPGLVVGGVNWSGYQARRCAALVRGSLVLTTATSCAASAGHHRLICAGHMRHYPEHWVGLGRGLYRTPATSRPLALVRRLGERIYTRSAIPVADSRVAPWHGLGTSVPGLASPATPAGFRPTSPARATFETWFPADAQN